MHFVRGGDINRQGGLTVGQKTPLEMRVVLGSVGSESGSCTSKERLG